MKQKSFFVRKFDTDIKGKDDTLKPPGKLSEYSQWMADFNPNRQGRGLEIPGWYYCIYHKYLNNLTSVKLQCWVGNILS